MDLRQKEAYKRWYNKNKDKVYLYQHKRYLRNKTEILEKARAYKKKNREKVAKYNKLWRMQNKDKIQGYSQKRKIKLSKTK